MPLDVCADVCVCESKAASTRALILYLERVLLCGSVCARLREPENLVAALMLT